MKRKIDSDLLNWKNKHDRKPLILLGPRQVGKTYSVDKFAKNNYLDYVYINFMDDNEIKKLLIKQTSPKLIIEIIISFFHIQSFKNIIFVFDEIQEAPNIKTSLKMFCEQYPNISIIALGSYLGNIIDRASFPVGKVDILFMKPMNFEEFLWSQNQNDLSEYLHKISKSREQVDNIKHELALKYFFDYLIIGGMPKALKTYKVTQDLFETNIIKENIIFGYTNDIIKFIDYNTDKVKAMNIYDNIQRFLINENRRYKLSEINKNARYRDYQTAIASLIKSNVILKVNMSKNAHAPLMMYDNDSSFKLYFNDVGMLATKLRINKGMLNNENYGNTKGGLFENFFVQELYNKIDCINYYTFMINGNRYEIDFLIEDSYGNPIPIEIKSGISYKIKSMKKFLENNSSISYGIVFSQKNISYDEKLKIFTLPIYLISFLEIDKLVKKIKAFI
ncbi:MAG: ATP-binding protein [Mycoplasmoidaceae bacterium]